MRSRHTTKGQVTLVYRASFLFLFSRDDETTDTETRQDKGIYCEDARKSGAVEVKLVPVRNTTSPELKRETKTADDQRRRRQDGNRTNTTETRQANAYTTGTRRESACGGGRRRCSRMYRSFEDSAAACTTVQQHVQQRDTNAAACITKSYTRSHVYNKELQAQPHVQHYPPPKKRHPLLLMEASKIEVI